MFLQDATQLYVYPSYQSNSSTHNTTKNELKRLLTLLFSIAFV